MTDHTDPFTVLRDVTIVDTDDAPDVEYGIYLAHRFADAPSTPQTPDPDEGKVSASPPAKEGT